MSRQVIICVDDERTVLRSLKAELQEAVGNDYTIEIAEGGEEALELIEELLEDGDEIPLIISDHIMPDMKGDELLIRIHKEYPNVIKIMLTGQADEVAIERAKKQANLHSCLFKPWLESDLLETIKSGLSKL